MKKIIPLFLTLCSSLFADAKLVVIRHGEGDHNLQFVISSWTQEEGGVDHALTEKGRRQVAETAQKLLEQGINKENVGLVLVSPMRRTRQTAQILADWGVCDESRIYIEERIREAVAQEWEGKHVGKIHAALPDFKNWLAEVQASADHGGEPPSSVEDRIGAVLAELSAWDPANGHVLLVMHGFPSMVLLQLHGDGSSPKLETAEARVLPLQRP
ncbi:MAG: histidine phosphatase family protein [Verrucomicrobia bacterium]|nr:histidine phosphatase family protein [Verrucomicrobiota bacterium]